MSVPVYQVYILIIQEYFGREVRGVYVVNDVDVPQGGLYHPKWLLLGVQYMVNSYILVNPHERNKLVGRYILDQYTPRDPIPSVITPCNIPNG